jgi:uncharacterized protein YdcH (DUF465 family)
MPYFTRRWNRLDDEITFVNGNQQFKKAVVQQLRQEAEIPEDRS